MLSFHKALIPPLWLYNKDKIKLNWRHPSLSELIPMVFNTGLTQLGLEAFKLSLVSSDLKLDCLLIDPF